ncbi:MAG: hypothetical protein Q7T03_03490, partial [Deltaproteobacteria bacterium]|nr:hypothetical protein [Deltaproteobacteria bacterium]
GSSDSFYRTSIGQDLLKGGEGYAIQQNSTGDPIGDTFVRAAVYGAEGKCSLCNASLGLASGAGLGVVGILKNVSGNPPYGMSPRTLTPSEIGDLQSIANKYNTEINVVGSRAAGEGRNINTGFPVGKGSGTRSDIDVRVSGQAVIDSHGRLADDLKNMGNGNLVQIVSGGLPDIPSRPPVIIIKPAR